ncbi:MAG: arginase family protein, partial [Thermoproteota archaeon]
MSYLDLYLNKNPLITSPNEGGEASVIVYGIPFDSTHSFRPGTRFGPDAI